MKTLEDEITEQFNHLVATYQEFPDPFKIYSIRQIPEESEFFKNYIGNEELSTFSMGDFPEFWTWDEDSHYFTIYEDDNNDYKITALIFQKDINWALTILKNCEFAYGVHEKEIILLPRIKVQIIEIKGKNFLREFKR